LRSLSFLAALVLLSAPALAQVVKDDKTGDASELKKRFAGKQRPEDARKGGAQAEKGDEASAEELEGLLLAAGDGYKKDEADTTSLDADLKTTIRIVHRDDLAGFKEYAVIVPKEVAAGRQLVYKSVVTSRPPLLLKRVWGHKHFLVLEFDKQQQYLDLLRPDKDSGFVLAGFVVSDDGVPSARQFRDPDAFASALETFVKIPVPPGFAERVKTVTGGAPYYLEASKTSRGPVVLILSKGVVTVVNADGTIK
jgi:hypothetical protein